MGHWLRARGRQEPVTGAPRSLSAPGTGNAARRAVSCNHDGDLEWDRLEAEPPRPARYQRSPPGETWSFARVRLGNAGQGQEARPPRKREEEGNRTAGWPGSFVRLDHLSVKVR